MNKTVWSTGTRLGSAVVLVLASVSCGTLTRQGTSPAYLIIQSMEAARGSEVTAFGSFLLSDVVTVVDDVPTTFNDIARVTFMLGLKDPGSASSPTSPTQNNWITVEQYHVRFIRADGHNIEGVDVPYAFDGGLTATVSDPVSVGFQLVRHNAKEEAPLAALQFSPVVISTVAEITFYGHDQTGRQVSAIGRLGVNFGNFADPQ
jgi:hypothetical protein